MNCREAYELVLEVDPADLRGDGDTPLAVHLQTCDRCAARAALILGAQTTIADALSARRPRTPANAAVERAAVQARRRRARRRLAWRAGPALAAATLAGIVLSQYTGGDRATPTGADQPQGPDSNPPPVLVQAPPDRNVMVFETDNPDILVVWLY